MGNHNVKLVRLSLSNNAKDRGVRGVARDYHEKKLQVQACDWPQRDDREVKAGQGTLRNWELKQEGEDSQQICVDVVERELHKHSTGPMKTHKQIHTPGIRSGVKIFHFLFWNQL